LPTTATVDDKPKEPKKSQSKLLKVSNAKPKLRCLIIQHTDGLVISYPPHH
jgi:hypothetical protein